MQVPLGESGPLTFDPTAIDHEVPVDPSATSLHRGKARQAAANQRRDGTGPAPAVHLRASCFRHQHPRPKVRCTYAAMEIGYLPSASPLPARTPYPQGPNPSCQPVATLADRHLQALIKEKAANEPEATLSPHSHHITRESHSDKSLDEPRRQESLTRQHAPPPLGRT